MKSAFGDKRKYSGHNSTAAGGRKYKPSNGAAGNNGKANSMRLKFTNKSPSYGGGNKSNNSSPGSSSKKHIDFQRVPSLDNVRKIVQKEGKAARNLIAFNVPLENQDENDHKRRQRTLSAGCIKPLSYSSANVTSNKSLSVSHTESPKKSRSRSREKGKGDLRARYWAFLFDNLQRAVEEIYQTCEVDESVVQCKEVIMMLNHCTQDFKNLIHRFSVIKDYEKLDPQQRPTSIAWDVRKFPSSPPKQPSVGHSLSLDTPSGKPSIRKSLNFSTPDQAKIGSNTSTKIPQQVSQSNTISWADRVKNVSSTQISLPKPEYLDIRPVLSDAEGSTAPVPKNIDAKLSEETATVTQNLGPTITVESPTSLTNSLSVSPRSPKPSSGPIIADQDETATSSDGWQTVQTRRSRSNLARRQQQQQQNISRSCQRNQSPPQYNNIVKEEKAGSVSEVDCITNVIYVQDDNDRNEDRSLNENGIEEENIGTGTELKYSPNPAETSQEPNDWWDTADIVNSNLQEKTVDINENTITLETNAEKQNNKLDNPSDSSTATPDVNMVSPGGLLSEVRSRLVESPLPRDVDSPPPASASGYATTDDDEDTEALVETELVSDALKSAMDEEDTLTTEIAKEKYRLHNDSSYMDDDDVDQLPEDVKNVGTLDSVNGDEADIQLSPQEKLYLEASADALASSRESRPLSALSQFDTSWESIVARHEAEREKQHLRNWADIIEEHESRIPGHSVQLHEKLSSPSRKKNQDEARRKYEEKQAKAQQQRQKFQQEKAQRLHELTRKVDEVRQWKEELLTQKRATMEKKLQRAEEMRQSELQKIVRKAREEEAKANEIAFINSLDAQNKRHDIMSKLQDAEARLQDMQEERLRKHEEKAAREAAVEERRRSLEAERQRRLQDLRERRRLKEEKAELFHQERAAGRQEAAREKERLREERLAALEAKEAVRTESLKKEIEYKMCVSAKRHEESLEQIRQKAIELSIMKHNVSGDLSDAPSSLPYERKKICTVCDFIIHSEVHLLSHVQGKKHQQRIPHELSRNPNITKAEQEAFNVKCIQDLPVDRIDPQVALNQERQKAQKRRCKKLRQRMSQRGLEYENSLESKSQIECNSPNRPKLQRLVRDLNKQLQAQAQCRGSWPEKLVGFLDRSLGEICRILEKRTDSDQHILRSVGGLTCISRILLLMDPSPLNNQGSGDAMAFAVPQKSLLLACRAYGKAVVNNWESCFYLLFSNKLGSILELLAHQLQLSLPEVVSEQTATDQTPSSLPYNPLVTALLQLLSVILNRLTVRPDNVSKDTKQNEAFSNRIHDVVSYIISLSIVDRLVAYFDRVRFPIDSVPAVGEMIEQSLKMLIALSSLLAKRNDDIFNNIELARGKKRRESEDTTQLSKTIFCTDLMGKQVLRFKLSSATCRVRLLTDFDVHGLTKTPANCTAGVIFKLTSVVSLVYSILLHSPKVDTNSETQQPKVSFGCHTYTVCLLSLKLLNTWATLDLAMLQRGFGADGTWLQFRHVCSYLLSQFSSDSSDTTGSPRFGQAILHELLLCIGYFSVANKDNQAIIQSGQSPTILQRLCALPFSYFADPKLTNILLPTLISCCHDNDHNRAVLEQDVGGVMLAKFIQNKKNELSLKETKPVSSHNSESDAFDTRFELAMRFPLSFWEATVDYFNKSLSK